MLWPKTNQLIVWPAGRADRGVQVRTVLPALQADETAMGLKEPSKTEAAVATVFIAALKVKVMVLAVETPVAPLAGTVEMSITCACAWPRQNNEPAMPSIQAKSR